MPSFSSKNYSNVAGLKIVSPEELGITSPRWDQIQNWASELCDSNQVPALSFQYQRSGKATPPQYFGIAQSDSSAPITDDTLFLIASLTKPMVAMAVMLLVQRGLLSLNRRVATILPGFKEASKRNITVRHLLTHTSGLPDMLPNNQELREQNSSLERFVEETIDTELVFSPGRGAQYQSMGYALLGPIIEQVSRMNYQQFLKQELFDPLEMHNTWLGLPNDIIEQGPT